MVAALGPLVASAAEPPRDYALPLTTLSATGESTGVTLVDAVDFSLFAPVVPDTSVVSQTHVLYGGTAGVDRRPYVLVYEQNGHWMRMSLRDGLAPVPQQISSASNANAACASTLVETTRGATPSAMLVYHLPGPDATCGTSDDPFRKIGVADGAGVAPAIVPVTTLDLHPVYVSNALVSVLTHEKGQLLRYPANLASATVVRAASTAMFAGQIADGTSFVVLDGSLRKVSKEGTTPLLVTKSPQNGYVIKSVALAGDQLFIFEDALRASANWQTRIYRLKASGGGLLAVAIVNLTVPSTFAGVTDTKILYLQTPKELKSVPRDTNQFRNDSTRIYRTETGVVELVATRGDRIFFNVNESGAAIPYRHADVRRDDGLAVVNGTRGSAWLAVKPDVEDPRVATNATTLLLARNPLDEVTLAGASLFRFDAATLAMKFIRGLPDDTRPGPLNGIGPATAEDFLTPDAFTVDVGEARFRRFVGASALR